MDLYKEELMDHFRHPRNKGLVQNADFASESCNPSCGDSVSMSGTVVGTVLSVVQFQGKGCVISQAAASMLTQRATGMALEDVQAVDVNFMLKLVGIPLGPNRTRCALLALEALHKGIATYSSGRE